jgi:hypothetical protein
MANVAYRSLDNAEVIDVEFVSLQGQSRLLNFSSTHEQGHGFAGEADRAFADPIDQCASCALARYRLQTHRL